MAYRASVIGASVSALVGGISRAVPVSFRLADVSQDTAWAVLVAAAIGIIVGAPAGAIDTPAFGGVIGAMLSVSGLSGQPAHWRCSFTSWAR